MRWLLSIALVVAAVGPRVAAAQPGEPTPADPADPPADPADTSASDADDTDDALPERPLPPPNPDAPPPQPVGDPADSANGAPPPQPVGPVPEEFGQTGTTFRAHTGLLLRAYSGFGIMTTSTSSEGVDIDVGGNATSLGLSAGYSLRPRLAVHFDLVLNLMANPEIKIGGMDMGNGSGGLIGVGPGVSYYLVPKVNAYLAGSLLIFDRFVEQNDMAFRNTKAGLAANFVFGKEWWLGGSTGLGLVGQAFFGSNPESATDDSWTTFAFTLNFSATYN